MIIKFSVKFTKELFRHFGEVETMLDEEVLFFK